MASTALGQKTSTQSHSVISEILDRFSFLDRRQNELFYKSVADFNICLDQFFFLGNLYAWVPIAEVSHCQNNLQLPADIRYPPIRVETCFQI